jgi:ectoine hydroxylase-related dioxygenase (phytanoyl-CoA dioxygenase family)
MESSDLGKDHGNHRGDGYSIDFVINDQSANYPVRTVRTTAAHDDVAALEQNGYTVVRGLVPAAGVAALAGAVSGMAEAESRHPSSEFYPGHNIYLRSLLDKDAVFHSLLHLEPVLSMARLLLGPQVWIDLDARMTFSATAGIAVPWHIHIPVIPRPRPAFFCYPHQIHCLIYLDPVGEDEGPLCLLPASHTQDLTIPLNDNSDREGQVELKFAPGDAIVMHGNLWHRVRKTTAKAGLRRLLLLGYVPSWVKGDVARGVRAERPMTRDLMRNADAETAELLGTFSW